MESRVVPGISETIVRSSSQSAFSSDDLPTFGRPRMETPISSVVRSTRATSSSRRRATISSSRSPVAMPCSA